MPLLALLFALAGPPKGVAVLELYTSEGCSSCPPADALLAKLADEPGVVAVEMHVDYWNKLGWADPFSQAAFSGRQEQAAARLGVEVYTPQLVVNGAEAMVGSDERKVRAAIEEWKGRPAAATLELTVEGRTIRYRASGGATVTIAVVTPSVTSRVTRGENAGATLRHVNVARWVVEVPAGTGSVQSPVDVEKVVGWVTDGDGGVLGAAR